MESQLSSIATFTYIDYAVFVSMLILSALIGFYYAWAERNKRSVDRILLGGRKLKIFPVAMSIMASFTSAISVLGFSLEMYRFGSMYMLIGLSYFLTQPFAAFVYVPFFHRLNITSAYEFLYMAVVLYSPSLAIQQVTGIPLWVSIFVTGLVCTVYTSLGGMKAVVFTDTFQVFVMFFGLFAIVIEGIRRVGSVGLILDRFIEGERLEFFDFNPTLFQRHTFWSIMVGGFFTSLTVYGSNQATIQRYLALPSIRAAQIAMFWNLVGTLSILILCCFCGIVCYAFYYGCDPFLNKQITRYDQILPYFVMDILRNYYGLAGLFIACVYSAALSTVSSGLNSLVAVFLHDFIYPFHLSFLGRSELTETRSMILSKIIAATFGLLTIFLSYLCEYVGTTVLQISLSIFGILGGPLLGVISLGMFVPCANSNGALFGLLVSILINFWLSIGQILYGQKPKSKPFRTDMCDSNLIVGLNNSSWHNSTVSTSFLNNYSDFKLSRIYDISYYWFSLIGIFVVFFFGILVSLAFQEKDKKVLDKNLSIDLFEKTKLFFRSIFKLDQKLNANVNEEDKHIELKLLNDSVSPDLKP